MAPRKIAYLVSRFPKLSETFILREMIAMRNDGWEISLYPLILEKTSMFHPEAEPWLKELFFFPGLSREVIFENIKLLFRKTGKYISVFLQVVLGNIQSPSFLIRAFVIFPKAVRMAGHMKSSEISHIHAHFATHPALAAWIIHRLAGITYSITIHAHDLYVNKTMLERKVLDAAFVVVISEFNKNFLIQHVDSIAKGKIHVIHCGVDFRSLPISKPENLEDDRFHIISIGSLQPYKGMQYLIRACQLLRDRGLFIECKIIGGGKERKKLETLLVSHGLQQVVTMLGSKTQEDVFRNLSKSQCYVQPSVVEPSGKMEGIPVSIMEALACGLPVIASEISGIPELVRPGKTGYLVPPADPMALADAIENVYKNSREAARLAQAGQKLVREEFDLFSNVKKLSQLFNQIPVL